MKKLAHKFLATTMACMLAVAAVAPMTAEAATVAKTTTVYLTGKNSTSYVSIDIEGLKKNSKVTNVKSSKNAIATPYRISTHNNTYTYDYLEPLYTDSTYSYSYGDIELRAQKAGTTKVSFKVDGKSMSTDLRILNYTNPIKTANILGIKSGGSTNLASKTQNANYTDLKLNKTVSNGKLEFKPNKGWKITYVSFSNDSTGTYQSLSNGNGLSSATMYVGKVTGKQSGYAYVRCMNTKNGAEMTCYYYINN